MLQSECSRSWLAWVGESVLRVSLKEEAPCQRSSKCSLSRRDGKEEVTRIPPNLLEGRNLSKKTSEIG